MSIRWIDGRPGLWYGFTDFGPIQIPPTPMYLSLTDRADGVTQWWLTYSLTPPGPDGLGYIAINSAPPPFGYPSVTFAPYGEPYFPGSNGAKRLIVRGAQLGAEIIVPPLMVRDEGQEQIYARMQGLNIPMRQIILSTSPPGFYSWVPYTYVQTPNPVCPPPCT
jgi:hypothetical protein